MPPVLRRNRRSDARKRTVSALGVRGRAFQREISAVQWSDEISPPYESVSFASPHQRDPPPSSSRFTNLRPHRAVHVGVLAPDGLLKRDRPQQSRSFSDVTVSYSLDSDSRGRESNAVHRSSLRSGIAPGSLLFARHADSNHDNDNQSDDQDHPQQRARGLCRCRCHGLRFHGRRGRYLGSRRCLCGLG